MYWGPINIYQVSHIVYIQSLCISKHAFSMYTEHCQCLGSQLTCIGSLLTCIGSMFTCIGSLLARHGSC
jgi:hypothetical protein